LLAGVFQSSSRFQWRREAAGGHSCQLNCEMDDCRRYAADQKAKYDDDDRFRDWRPH
jgi:hypothetical protein